MTIAFVAGLIGGNNSGTSQAQTLPTGTAAGDLTIAAFTCSVTPAVPVSPPSGWTAIYSAPNVLICYRVFQTGDPTSITATAAAVGTNFWESIACTYSGVDTTNPIDAANGCTAYSSGTPYGAPEFCRAPSVNPNYATDRLIGIWGFAYDGGTTLSLPSGGGFTSRENTGTGPSILWGDKALTTTASTGRLDCGTGSAASTQQQWGVQIALKTAGATSSTPAAALVTTAGVYASGNDAGGTTVTADISQVGPLPGDLIVAFVNGITSAGVVAASITPPSGYTQQAFSGGQGVFTHAYGSGDPTSLTFTFPVSLFSLVTVYVLRISGTTSETLQVDTVGTATSATTSVSSPSLTPASTNELLLCGFGQVGYGQSTYTGGTGLVIDVENRAGPNLVVGWVEPVASPTGAFSMTASNAKMVVQALLAKIAGTPPPVVLIRPLQMICT